MATTVGNRNKRTKYTVWCVSCKDESRISIEHQRQAQPKHCPFCGGGLIVDSIRTVPVRP